MGPYSHFILATKLEKQLQPETPGEYYWGAVIPDIRYLAQMKRDQTHVGQENLKQWLACYPQLKSFLLGYQVHCLIDQIDIAHLVNTAFPLNIIKRVTRRKFSQQQMTMLVEMHYLQSPAGAERLAGSHNEIIQNLGITPEQTSVYFQAMQAYIESHSFDTAISTFQKIGMFENSRLEKYLTVYRSMQNRKLMNAMIMLSVKNARLDQRIMDYVQSRMSV